MSEDEPSDVDLIRAQVSDVLSGGAPQLAMLALLQASGSSDVATWGQAKEYGWCGVGIPIAYEGIEMGLAERCAIAEEIGRALASIPFTVSSCAAAAVLHHGSEQQKAALLPGLATGELIATLACFAPGDGYPSACSVTLRDGQISGVRSSVCAGAFADFALVPARDECGRDVLSIADLRTPTVFRDVRETIDNSRGYADLVFDGAPVDVLAGSGLLDIILAELATMTAFEQIGGAQACLDAACNFARERHAFGQPIGAFQAIKHGLADLYVLIEEARGAALAALDRSACDRVVASAAARLAASRAYDQCAQESIQVHGGLGCTWEAPHHLHYRRSRCLALEWGGPPYWRHMLLRNSVRMASHDGQ